MWSDQNSSFFSETGTAPLLGRSLSLAFGLVMLLALAQAVFLFRYFWVSDRTSVTLQVLFFLEILLLPALAFLGLYVRFAACAAMKILPPQTHPPSSRIERLHAPEAATGRHGCRSFRPCLRWEFGFSGHADHHRLVPWLAEQAHDI